MGGGAGSGIPVIDDVQYCTIADVRGPDSSFTIPAGYSDSDIMEIIQECMGKIDAMCRDRFLPVNRVLILNGDGTPYMSFRKVTQLRCQQVTRLQYREVYDPTDNFDTAGVDEVLTVFSLQKSRRGLVRIVTGDWRTDPNMNITDLGQIGMPPAWIRGYRNYKVSGVFGWSFLPPPIHRACIYLAREAIQPGWINKSIEPKVMERFADGYQYTTLAGIRGTVAQVASLSGFQVIDNLIGPYQNLTPILIATNPYDAP